MPAGRYPSRTAGGHAIRCAEVTIVLGLLAAVLWGVPDVPLAVAIRRVGEVPVLVWSLAIGTLAAMPIVAATGAPHLTARGVGLAVAAAAITVPAYLTAFAAFQTCPVSVVTPILSCEGAAAAVIAVIFGERLSPILAISLGFAVLGVVLVGLSGGNHERAHVRGVAFVCLAALIWGGVLALGAPVSRGLGVWWGFLLVRIFALVFALALGLGTRHRRRLGSALRFEPWRIVVWGLSDTGAYLSFYLAAHHGPLAVASVLAAQFALFGALSGVLLLGERLRAHQWLGMAIVLGAVSVISTAT
jgi:drug/metabolite transporter (DMT)-like permease